jgi:protein PhnA
MTDVQPPCPACGSAYTYEMPPLLVCPECAHEWSPEADAEAAQAARSKDVNGNPLSDGDDVIVVKDLKVKGSSQPLKGGTKVKSIRLVDGPDGHDIEAKAGSFGSIYLKSSKVKKA